MTTLYWKTPKPFSKEVVHDLMSAIKQHTVSPAAASATNSNEAAPHSADSSHVEELSAVAGNSSKQASFGMPLLLTSFNTKVPVPLTP